MIPLISSRVPFCVLLFCEILVFNDCVVLTIETAALKLDFSSGEGGL